MDWHNIHITNEENINGMQFKIQEAYDPIVIAATAPKEFALFSRFNSEDGTVDIFISPQLSTFANLLLKKFDAAVCEKPKPDKITLLTGTQNALELFGFK